MHHASPLSTVHCFCVYRGRSLSLPVPYSSTHVVSAYCGARAHSTFVYRRLNPVAIAPGSVFVDPRCQRLLSRACALNRLCTAGWSRSLPPPQPGCPSGDPGPLPVPYLSTHVVRLFA
jgi:hypothetical protein